MYAYSYTFPLQKNIEEDRHLFGSLLGIIMGLHRDKGLNITQKEQMLHL